MGDNILILCLEGDGVECAARLATESGDELGFVNTAIEFADEKVRGGRVEDEREYGGTQFNTFDEPVFIGSAIAQLAGYTDCVVVQSLDDWAYRLIQKFDDDMVEIEAEISSLESVMRAKMCDLILLSRPHVDDAKVEQVLALILQKIDPQTDKMGEAKGGDMTWTRGG